VTTTPRSSGSQRGQEASPATVEPLGRSVAGQDDEPARPLLRVVSGSPTAEELAALTVVVAALSQRRPRRRPTPVGAWAARGDVVRTPLQAGPGGWRAAGRFA